MTTRTRNRTKVIAEPGKLEIRIERTFDAPPGLVFKAFIDPDLVKQWLGPRKYTMVLDKYEPRKGGIWRFIHKDESSEHSFNGVFHEIVAPTRIVRTFEYEGYPGHVQMETAWFEPEGNKTRVISQSVFQSVDDRDGMLQNGMEEGMNEGNERLDELLEKLQR